MSSAIWARMHRRWSGGESRVGDPAADGADRSFELHPVRVDARAGRGGANQGADRVVGQEVAPDLLLNHVRGLRPQYPARAPEEGLELGVGGLKEQARLHA